MIFASATRFNRYVFAAFPMLALVAFSASCSSNDNGTGSGGSAGSTGPGGSGGAGATGGAGGAAGNGGATGGAGGSAGKVGATGGSGGSAGAGGATGGAGGAGGATGGATGGAGGADGGGVGGASGAGGGDAGTGLTGSFIITLKSEPDPAFTNFVGRIYDGTQPPFQVLKLDSEESGCQLLVPKAPFCMGGCSGGVCVDDDTCVLYPNLVGLGTVDVTGLKVGAFSIPESQTKVYQVTPTLPPNACDEGADIDVRSNRLTLQGKCVAPLELTAMPTDKIPVRSGMPVRVLWKAPGQAGLSRVEIHLDIAHHGGKKGEINCDVPDTGSFDIPAALTTKLIGLGLAGFPTINVRRVHTAYAVNESKVRIQIDSDLERQVETGVVSCNDTMPCPAGQMCGVDQTCK